MAILDTFTCTITNPATGAVSSYNCYPDNTVVVITTSTNGTSTFSTYSDVDQIDTSMHYGIEEAYSLWNAWICENDPDCGCIRHTKQTPNTLQ